MVRVISHGVAYFLLLLGVIGIALPILPGLPFLVLGLAILGIGHDAVKGHTFDAEVIEAALFGIDAKGRSRRGGRQAAEHHGRCRDLQTETLHLC